MSDKNLTFKEMCAKFDVTPRTLRYYEYIELLYPSREGRARYYSAREVARMTLIVRGRRWGFSLEGTRQFLMLYEEQGNDAQMQAWVKSAGTQLEELAKQRADLDVAIDELTRNREETMAALRAQK